MDLNDFLSALVGDDGFDKDSSILLVVSSSDVWEERFAGIIDPSFSSSFVSCFFLKKLAILFFDLFISRGIIKSGELLLTFPTSSETG